jgi:hypothetical protein
MIRKFSPRASSLAAFVALAALSGCAVNLAGGTITVTKSFDAKVTAQSPVDLLVDVPIGAVTIKAGPADSAEVTVTGTLGGADPETLDAVKVTVAQEEGGKTSVRAEGPNGKSWKADLTITTPARTSLMLDSGVGAVKVSGLEGKMKATLGVGALTVEKQVLTGDSSFQSGTGNVSLDVTSWPKDSTLKAESGTGNVTVRLPAGLGMNVDASTGVGKLNTKGLTFQRESRMISVVGATVKGRTNEEPEGRTLKASSGTGNVRIEAAQ